ncbi:MAG TPA: ABC transporter substrate-binding protein [Halanaerobiales bacterium]|nr:ABC transporter substrate-binding protein [Halanaerobiales bacterium]
MKRLSVILVAVFLITAMFTATGVLAQSADEISSRVEVEGWKYVIDSSDNMVDTSQYKKDGPYTIGYVTIFMANSWSAQMKEEIVREAERQEEVEGIQHINAQSSVSGQISAVEDLVAKGVDAIVIDPISPEALVGALESARENGVPVIAISSTIPAEQVTAWVGRSDYDYGNVTAKWLVEKMNGEGNVVALSGIAGNSTAQSRWQGAKDVFDEYPDIEILTREFAQWGFAQAKTAMSNVLAGYSNIDAVWSGGGAMTQGAMEAFESAGREMVPMVGEANNGFLLDWIEASDQGFESIAFNNPTSHSAIGMRLALKALKGEPIPESVYATGPYILGLDEAKKYARPDLEDGYWTGHTLSEEALEELWGK